MFRGGAILLTALALAGCGTTSSATDFEGDQRAVADAVENLQVAAEGSDEGAICQTLLAQVLIDRLESGGGDCRKEISSALDDTDAVGLEVQKVTITGTTATATVEAREGEDDVLRELKLVRERDDWRISELGTPSPAPKRD